MPGDVTSLWWGLILLGVAAGVLSGSLGLGSGILLVPAFVLIFAFDQKAAQGTALAVMVPMVLVGALRYKLNPDIAVSLPVAGLVAVGAVVGALAGATLAGRLSSQVLRKAFAVFLVVVAARMLLAHPPKSNTQAGPVSGTVTQGGPGNDGRK